MTGWRMEVPSLRIPREIEEAAKYDLFAATMLSCWRSLRKVRTEVVTIARAVAALGVEDDTKQKLFLEACAHRGYARAMRTSVGAVERLVDDIEEPSGAWVRDYLAASLRLAAFTETGESPA